MSYSTDTIAALATPVGTSAIAVVRASGPRVAEMTREIFTGLPVPRVATRHDYCDKEGRLVDDVLFTFFAAPNSFTGEDSLEISCHGNPFIAQKILEDLLARGCLPAEAGAFSKRAFLNGRIDLTQAEAVMDLIHARSERALAAANQQLRGSLGREMEKLITLVVNMLAIIEAQIDFPEEDLPAEDRHKIAGSLSELLVATSRLLATSHYGELLRDGIKTVIVGEPNAGKSSLLNRLVGHDRALVSPEPGTTRDFIEERILLGPHWLRLIDTAGLSRLPSPLEQRGIEKTFEQAIGANLFLWVIDSTAPVWDLPPEIRSRISPANTVVVLNKADLPAAPRASQTFGFSPVEVSATIGTGIHQLEEALVQLAESMRSEVGAELIAINARHAGALNEAKLHLTRCAGNLAGDNASELLASDLRCALECFGQLAGRIDNERVLDVLFSQFCIGK